MISAEVTKATTESNASVLRRFTKKVQGLGTIRLVRKLRYSARQLSDFKKKKEALKRIEKRTNIDRLKKLGKIKEREGRKDAVRK